ncbi:hypothetical protein C8R48DRAFT_673798 [Suillus tomentosus]|nr:hypothetical protein C8R48DRAFT_673798 [Suillus tomentosus]
MMQGLEKMFNIFMSKEMVHAMPGGGFELSLNFNQDLMGNNVDYLYTIGPKMENLRNNGQEHYETLLQYSQLPAIYDPNNNLTDHPVTIPPERRTCPPSINVSDISYVAPSLQGMVNSNSIPPSLWDIMEDHFKTPPGPSAKCAPAENAVLLPKRRHIKGKQPATQGELWMSESGGD